jgi:hypothetical protein
MRGQLAVPRAGREVLHLRRQGGERFHLGIFQDRREEAAFDGHGDGHVRGFSFSIRSPAQTALAIGHGLQRKRAGLDDEIVDRQLHAARLPAAC